MITTAIIITISGSIFNHKWFFIQLFKIVLQLLNELFGCIEVHVGGVAVRVSEMTGRAVLIVICAHVHASASLE